MHSFIDIDSSAGLPDDIIQVPCLDLQGGSRRSDELPIRHWYETAGRSFYFVPLFKGRLARLSLSGNCLMTSAGKSK